MTRLRDDARTPSRRASLARTAIAVAARWSTAILFVSIAGLWCRTLGTTETFDWVTSATPAADGTVVTRRWWGQISGGEVFFDRHVIRTRLDDGESVRDEFYRRAVWRSASGATHFVPFAIPCRPPQILERGRLIAAGPFGLGRARITSPPPLPMFEHDHASMFFPLWSPLAVLAAPIVMIARRSHLRRRARGRSSRGECVACGYDLRGSSGRCPECGTAGT